MKKKVLLPSKVKKITGASYHGPVPYPFYYAPPLLDDLRNLLESRLASRGGRPTLSGMQIVRKVRFSKESWDRLERLAKGWSKKGSSISPAQIASLIFEHTFLYSKPKKSDKQIQQKKTIKRTH